MTEIMQVIAEVEETPAPPDPRNAVEFSSGTGGTFAEMPVDQIMASSTNPRKVFHEKPLDELAASIARVGVLEPVLVRLAPGFDLVSGRQSGKNGYIWENMKDQILFGFQTDQAVAEARPPYEIVAGERRWRASKLAKLDKIPVIIKDLTDEQTLEIQIDENWQRKDLEPMDEARGLQFIMNKRGWTLDECAARLNKDVRFLAERLKLNDLIEECQTAMDEGKLLVTHAYLIARYGESDQRTIVKEVYGKNFDRENVTLYTLKHTITWKIETRLDKAVFDLKAIDLRKDGLACIDCPQRAGANPTLFDPVDPKDDRCLNSVCFANKTDQHFDNMLDRFSKAGKKRFGADYTAPTVYGWNKPNGKKYADALPREEYKESINVAGEGAVCGSSEKALLVSNWDNPREIEICRNRECTDHWMIDKSAKQNSTVSSANPEYLEKDFERRVYKAVGIRLVLEASKKFADQNELDNLGSDVRVNIAASLLSSAFEGYVADDLARDFLSKVAQKTFDCIDNHELIGPWLARYCTPQQLTELIFICSFGEKAYPGHNYGPINSTGVLKELADSFGLNYRLYDAEERFHQATDPKHKKKFEAYLNEVMDGKNVATPRMWDKKFKVDDSIPTYSDEELNGFADWDEPEIDDNAADGNSTANDDLTRSIDDDPLAEDIPDEAEDDE